MTLKQGGQFRVKRGGQLGVKYSTWRTERREKKKIKDQEKQTLIKELNLNKSNADSLIHKLSKQAVETMRAYHFHQINEQRRQGADVYFGKEEIPMYVEIEDRYNSTLSDFIKQVSLFMGLTDFDERFSPHIEGLRNFSLKEIPKYIGDEVETFEYYIKKYYTEKYLVTIVYLMDAVITLIQYDKPLPTESYKEKLEKEYEINPIPENEN